VHGWQMDFKLLCWHISLDFVSGAGLLGFNMRILVRWFLSFSLINDTQMGFLFLSGSKMGFHQWTLRMKNYFSSPTAQAREWTWIKCVGFEGITVFFLLALYMVHGVGT